MKGIEVPERSEDFTADPVELFFDLAYVFAFSQLVVHVVHHPTWSGVGEAALLFWLMWLPWSQFTWAANAVSGNGRPMRAVFLVGTVVSVPMAASVTTAFDEGGPIFAVSLASIVALGMATLMLTLTTTPEMSNSVLQWVVPGALGMGVVVIGGFVDGSARVWTWLAATGVMIIAMAVSGRNEWIVRTGHFAERHGLIVIIALGEIIVAIGVPVVAALEDTAGLPGTTALALVGAGAFAGLTWWSYFDRAAPAIEHRGEHLTDALERGRFVRDVYTGSHAPLVAGVILAASALEEIALHPEDHVEDAFRWILFGGLALVTAGISIGIWRSYRVIPRERAVALAVTAAVIAGSSSWDGWVVILAIDAIIAATLVAEHVRIER